MGLPDESWLPAEAWHAVAETPLFEEGVTKGWVVMWSGEPGPARLMEVAVLADGSGGFTVEPTGSWRDTTVYDDGTPDDRP